MKLKNEKFYWILPAIVLPFLCLIFSALGGGKQTQKTDAAPAGLNPLLPKPIVDVQKETLDKMSAYEKAARDSIARVRQEQKDSRSGSASPLSVADTKAEGLQRQLNQLQQTLQRQQQPDYVPVRPAPQHTEPAEADPQLEKIDRILNKVMHIQHPDQPVPGSPAPVKIAVEAVLSMDSTVNTISVVVPEKQVLATGGTIALRLEDSIRINGAVVPSGQIIYGVASINNDRMLIHITSLRSDRNIYQTDLQAYDLDGLPGIHIPGRISRDVAKESADQGINGINPMVYDPSLAGQAANAGVQAAKSLFSRKVRQVRVTVLPGYRLLLRDPRTKNTLAKKELKVDFLDSCALRPPGFVRGGPFLKASGVDGIDLALQSICLKDEQLWFALEFHNRSSITYIPEYTRWFIRDRRAFRRTAAQDLPLVPLYTTGQSPLAADSTRSVWTAFHPFALSKGKQLVVEIGKKNGGRTLVLEIDPKHILNAQRL
ncbi:MAG: conjugative transposon protein TraM [Bacteroidetes bacterium]|nr:conjugative transposon protein TraM [Bacteroidota bacterium]